MRLERPATVVTDFRIGESVKIVDGALSGFIGTIDSIDVPAENARLPYLCSVALPPWIFPRSGRAYGNGYGRLKLVYILRRAKTLVNHRDCINKFIFTRSQ
ncbi:MAG: transcription termination/antitermination protein NusG [Christensenellales bacterium]